MSVVTAEQAGTYIQVAKKLRINHPGRPDVVSARPTDPRTRQLTDDPDTAPTLVTLSEGDVVDVPALLATGGIRPRNVTQARRLEKAGDLEPQAEQKGQAS